jgi:putative ABC transport system permease protein
MGNEQMSQLFQDLRYAVRMLCKNPGFASVVVLTLALGIGANTAIFSVVTSVLLSPLPFPNSDRMVRIFRVQSETSGQSWQTSPSPADFWSLREHSRLLERVAAQRYQDLTLMGDGEPERIAGIGVSDQWLETVAAQPLLGRGFDAQEQAHGSNSDVTLISYGFWQRHFGGNQQVLGRTLRLNEKDYTVIGVMPSHFRYPYNPDVWFPMTFPPTATTPPDLNIAARMKPGVTEAQLGEELNTIAAQLAHEFPGNANIGLGSRPFDQEFRRDPNRSIMVLLLAVGFVLAIACVNVASLQLARSHARTRELAIRAAIGASRGRQIRQLLTESTLLALISGGFGLLLAVWVSKWLGVLIPSRVGEVIQQVRVDTSVLIFSAAACLLTGVLSGLAPALRLSQQSPVVALKENGRFGSGYGVRLLRLLVIAEVAMAVMLLIGAGSMTQSFVRLLQADVGYETSNLIKLNLALPQPTYNDPARRVSVIRQILQRLETVPGVVSAGVTSLQPIPRTTSNNVTALTLETQTDPTAPAPVINMRIVSPSYMHTMGMHLERGRGFTDQDTETSAPVVILNQAAARRFWAGQDPTGHRLKPAPPDDRSVTWYTIVGVVSDIAEPNDRLPETVYLVYPQGTQSQPAGEWSTTSVALMIRTAIEDPTMLGRIRSAVWEADRTLPLYDATTMQTAVAQPLSDRRLGTGMLIGFGTFGLLMAALGTYGVIGFCVSQRIPEFGIRLALGAQPSDLLRLVLIEGMRLVVMGLVIGIGAALILSRLLGSVMNGVGPHDPLVFIAASAALLLSGLLASWIPARRATKVDPLVALRYE